MFMICGRLVGYATSMDAKHLIYNPKTLMVSFQECESRSQSFSKPVSEEES